MALTNTAGIIATLSTATSAQNTAVENALTALSSDSSPANLLAFQGVMQKWTMYIDITTAMLKTFGDACKNIVRNIS